MVLLLVYESLISLEVKDEKQVDERLVYLHTEPDSKQQITCFHVLLSFFQQCRNDVRVFSLLLHHA